MNHTLVRALTLGVVTIIAAIMTGCADDKVHKRSETASRGVHMEAGAISKGAAQPVEIISQPEDQLAHKGEDITFAVIMQSPGQYKYQWFRNECSLQNGKSDFAKIEGSDSWHLHLKELETNAAGFYYCHITQKHTEQSTNSTEAALYVAGKAYKLNAMTITPVTGPLTPGTGTVPASDCSGPYYSYVKFPDPATGAFWWKMAQTGNGTAADVTAKPVISYDSKTVVMEDISGLCSCAGYGYTVAFKHCTGSYCSGSKFKFTIYVTSPSNASTTLKGTPITINVGWQ